MAAIVRALSASARRAPVAVIVVVLLLTGVLGYFSGQVEQDQSQESFSPDNEELAAANFASEVFEGSTNTVVQVVVTAPDGTDVVSPEGLQTATAIREAVLAAVPQEQLSAEQGSPVVTWMLPVEQSLASGEVPQQALASDDGVDQVYGGAVEQLPAEVVGLSEGLVAVDEGEQPVDATTALALVFLDTDVITEGADGLDEQTSLVSAAVRGVVDAVDGVEAPLDASAFAFELFFEADDSFTDEIARLFATAAAIIVGILFIVYLFPPRGSTTRVQAVRRAAADTGLTLFVIMASIGWMQGIGVLLGPDYLDLIGAFTPPTQIIPILLIGLGVDYAIHVNSRYREELAEGETVERSVERASTTVGVALLLATMTTALGFLTNITNPVPAIKDFGILAAVGIGVAFLLMLTFLPAVRVLLDRRAEGADRIPREALGGSSEGVLSRITESTAVFGENHAGSVVIASLLLGGLGFYGLTQLTTEFSFADFVPEDNPVRETFLTIEDEFTGGFGEQTQVVVDGEVATPDVHNATIAAVGDLADVDGVVTIGENAAAQSLVSAIGTQLQLAQAAQAAAAAPASGDVAGGDPAGGDAAGGDAAGGDAAGSDVTGGDAATGDAGGAAGSAGPGGAQPSPEQLQAAGTFAATATQLGLQPDLTVADDADVAMIYDALLAADPSAAGILARIDDEYVASQVVVQTQSAAVGAAELAGEIDEVFTPVADAGPEVTPTGTQIISDAIIGDLSSSQVSSLGLTLLAALVLLVAVFGIRDRRPLLGAITLFPVGLVLLWVFGMMAATGIPFGPVTSTISGLAIGIGVPFTIHITNRFIEDLAVRPDVDAALRSTLRHTGGALAGSALTTAAGFAILVTSSLTPFQQLGLVVAYAITFSLLASILVLPSYLAIWARRTGAEGRSAPDVTHDSPAEATRTS